MDGCRSDRGKWPAFTEKDAKEQPSSREREGEPVEEEIFGSRGWFLGAGDDSFCASRVCAGQRARWRTESLNWAAKRVDGRRSDRGKWPARDANDQPASTERGGTEMRKREPRGERNSFAYLKIEPSNP